MSTTPRTDEVEWGTIDEVLELSREMELELSLYRTNHYKYLRLLELTQKEFARLILRALSGDSSLDALVEELPKTQSEKDDEAKS